MRSFVSGPAGRPRHMLRGSSSQVCGRRSAARAWRPSAGDSSATPWVWVFLALTQPPIAGCKRLAGEEVTLAFTVIYHFWDFLTKLFLQLEVFERCLLSLDDCQRENKQPHDSDGVSGGETSAYIPLKQVSESTSAWHR